MKVRLATPDDNHLPYYSHSIVEAILTCPKWGLIRYKDRKYFKSGYRQMALEAGSTMHEVFAALRLWQLDSVQKLPEHAQFHGRRIFGDRWDYCFMRKSNPKDEALSLCFEILNSSEFYDDPTDSKRTIANMEETTIKYVDHQMAVMDRNEIWVQDRGRPDGLVGIEIPFSIVVDECIRYIGTIDGITYYIPNDIERLEENKTASRIDDAFRESYRVKSQPTGYTVAARLIVGNEAMEQTKIIAVKVKQTRSAEDYVSFVENRDDEAILDWHRTLMFTHRLATEYEGNYLMAPMFTHSCNRYFRPCGFVDLCAASREDQQMMFADMEIIPPSPSERNVLGLTDAPPTG